MASGVVQSKNFNKMTTSNSSLPTTFISKNVDATSKKKLGGQFSPPALQGVEKPGHVIPRHQGNKHDLKSTINPMTCIELRIMHG